MSLYKLYGLQSWNLFTVTGIAIAHSCVHIFEWVQILIEYTYLLVGMAPMVLSLNFLNRFPWSGLVIKSLKFPVVGHHSTVTYLLFIIIVTDENSTLMLFILLLPEALPYLKSSIDLWSYW